jgi:hypothetical protein
MTFEVVHTLGNNRRLCEDAFSGTPGVCTPGTRPLLSYLHGSQNSGPGPFLCLFKETVPGDWRIIIFIFCKN